MRHPSHRRNIVSESASESTRAMTTATNSKTLKTLETPKASRFAHAWRALHHRNFRLYFFGQTISLMGTWMTRLATYWLVYRLTHSALLLGIVGFAGHILTFVLAPFAGVLIERVDRRRLLFWTQVVAGLQSFALAALTLTHHLNIYEIIALTAIQGIINAFDMPGRQSFLIRMVDDKADLTNAIAINSSMANGARLFGPAVAGLVIASLGEGWCFLIDAVSYLPVIASLVAMRLPAHQPPRHETTMVEQLREGWNYVRTFTPIRTILTLFCIVSLMGCPYSVILPIFAGQVLHGGAHTLGWLTAAGGIGALTSGISLTLRKTPVGLTRMIPIASGTFGVALILFGLSSTLWISLVLMLFAGFGMLQGASASNTVIQTLVPEDMRARVMGYYTMAFVGSAPFGSLISGTLAHWIGAPRTVMFTGSVCLAAAIWFTTQLPKIRAVIRPIYEQMGLIPDRKAQTAA